MEENNNFVLMELKDKEYYICSQWSGFGQDNEKKGEYREPRYIPYDSAMKFNNIGYNRIVNDIFSFLHWQKCKGKAIVHKSILIKYLPDLVKPKRTVYNFRDTGFIDVRSTLGRKLSNKTSKSMKTKILRRDGNICQICGSKVLLTAHHILDRQFGGPTDELNLITVCEKCRPKVHKNKKIAQKLRNDMWNKFFESKFIEQQF